MAAVLMVNLPFAGHTNPTLPLARALARQGHEVSYVNAEEYRDKIEGTGAKFVPYNNYPSSPTEQQKKTMCFRAAFDTALCLEQRFDLLIYEMFFYPGIKIAQKLEIPCVRQFSQSAWSRKTLLDAPLFFKLSSIMIDHQVMGKKNKEHMGLIHKTMGEAIVNDKPSLNIVYVPQVFQKNRECFKEDYLFTVPEYESNQLSQQIPYAKMRSPVVYISLGSIISNRGFCLECLRAFGGKEMSVILNTGRIHPETLGKIPENIYAYSFVPQVEVLQHADAFLTHCGMNSVNEAMSYGVPMVAMPYINDQISNAQRVLELGIGKRVRSFPSSGRQLYKTVRDVCGDEGMRNRSREVQNLLKSETSLEEVVNQVERLIQTCSMEKGSEHE
jgi:MGT family glycosyltransferase